MCTRLAFALGHTVCGGEGNLDRRNRLFAMLDPIRDDAKNQRLGLRDGVLAAAPIFHRAGDFAHLGDPAAVVFSLGLDGELHTCAHFL